MYFSALAKFRIDQFTPAAVDDQQVVISSHGKLDANRFLDPRSKKSFKYDVCFV